MKELRKQGRGAVQALIKRISWHTMYLLKSRTIGKLNTELS